MGAHTGGAHVHAANGMDTREAARDVLARPGGARLSRFGLVAACVIVAAAVAWLPVYPGLSSAGRAALFILMTGAALWVSEALPAFAVSLVVIGLEIAILGRPGGVFASTPADWEIFVRPWSSPLFWLFFGGMVLAQGASRSGLDQNVAARALSAIGSSRRTILLGLMSLSFVFSMILSNTATASVMLLLVAPILSSLPHRDPFAMALLLGIVAATNLGGMATLIGTPPNAIAAGALAGAIDFGRWLVIGLPVGLGLVAIVYAYLALRYCREDSPVEALLPPPTGADDLPEKVIAGVTLLVTVALWMTTPLHGIPLAVVSFIPPCVLTASGVLKSADIRALPWDVLILLAGGLSLGVMVEATGLANWIATRFALAELHPAILALVLGYATLLASNVMSNTAAASIAIPIGLALGAPEQQAVIAVSVALSASAAMCLPISTPPNALVYSSGQIESRDLLVTGSFVGLLAPPLAVAWAWLVLG